MTTPSTFTIQRIRASLTPAQVAEEFGVDAEIVKRWDVGLDPPPVHVTRALRLIADHAADAGPVPLSNQNSLIRSKKRVADHGEVFTPPWLVDRMLDLVRGEAERIDSRVLEPACGSGNFLLAVLHRKLATVDATYGRSPFERRHYALLALACCYGIELLADNVVECRAAMLEVFASRLDLQDSSELQRAAAHILALNIVNGDALTMKDAQGGPITVAEWGYLGRGRYNRRDFRLDVLTGMADLSGEQSLFGGLGRHEVFQPTQSHPPMTVRELAALVEVGGV